MKIKQRPEDFIVVELDRFDLSRTGPYSLYRLVKRGIGTLEAVGALAKGWNLPRGQVAFGGLKDRHAQTEQAISIRGGPERTFENAQFRAEYLGRSRDPISRASFTGNRFEITVRDLSSIPDLAPLQRHGVPNYFDDQRFGSLRGTGGEFIGRALVRGEYERALQLAVASPAGEDRKAERERRTAMRDRWGDWAALARELPPSTERTVAAYLADHPTSFGFAFELLEQNLRILLLSAYQSWLWNRTLAARIRPLPGAYEVAYTAGRHVFYPSLDAKTQDALAELSIPLIAPGQELDETATALLAEEGVELRQFRLKKLAKTFFGKGRRDAIVAPAGLKSSLGDDELNRGRKRMTLRFELPKGSYATVVLKRLFHEPLQDDAEDD